MRAVIYGRQSAGDNDISESVEIQIERCQEIARKENIEVVGIYRDLNISGKTYPEGAEDIVKLDIAFQNWYKESSSIKMFRRGLGEVIEKLKDIDYIIVYDITRLYRPVSGSHLESYINQLLIYNKVKVMTLTGIVDVSSFSDSIITALLNRINDQQIAITRKKAIEGQTRLRDSGIHVNGIKSFGIEYVGKYKVQVDPLKAEVIKYIFENVANYVPYAEVLRYVNKNYNGLWKSIFHPSSCYNLLRNPVYCGLMKNSKGELIKCKQMEGKEIISFELWKKVQDIIDKRRPCPPKPKYHWLPFSGLFIDGYNGTHLAVNNSKGHLYYKTQVQMIDRKKSCAGAVWIDVNKKHYTGIYYAIIPILILGFIQRIKKAEKLQNKENEVEKYNIELSNIKIKEQQITEKYMEGLIDQSVFDEILRKNKKRKDELNKLIIETTSYNKVDMNTLLINQWKEYHKLVDNELSKSQYETLLKEVVQKIVVFPDKIIIHTNFGEIPLPRFLQKNHPHFPRYVIDLDKSDNVNTPTFNICDTKFVVTYKMPTSLDGDKTITQLAVFDNFIVQIQGTN